MKSVIAIIRCGTSLICFPNGAVTSWIVQKISESKFEKLMKKWVLIGGDTYIHLSKKEEIDSYLTNVLIAFSANYWAQKSSFIHKITCGLNFDARLHRWSFLWNQNVSPSGLLISFFFNLSFLSRPLIFVKLCVRLFGTMTFKSFCNFPWKRTPN